MVLRLFLHDRNMKRLPELWRCNRWRLSQKLNSRVVSARLSIVVNFIVLKISRFSDKNGIKQKPECRIFIVLQTEIFGPYRNRACKCYVIFA